MSLQSYVDSFKIDAPQGNIVSGLPINLAAIASEILDINTTEVVSAPVDLQLVFKHLQMAKTGDEVPWPHQVPVSGGLTNVTTGLSAAPATNTPVEAWAGTIQGTVPIGLRDIGHTLSIEYQWLFFKDPEGQTAESVTVIGGSLTSPNLTITIPPIVQDLNSTDFADTVAKAEPIKTIYVKLKVSARLGNTPPVEFTTPLLPLPVIAIPLPSVAALFREEDLLGDAVLVMIPLNSPIGSVAELNSVLHPLQVLLSEVNTAASVTSWALGVSGLLDAVNALTTRLPLTLHVALRKRDQYKDLGKDNFIVVDNWFDTDMEDRGSSALLVSPTRAMSFFQHDDFEGEELTLDARFDAPAGRFGGAVVRRLHVSNPQSEPANCVSQTDAPDNSWGDKISSYRWSALV